MGRLEDLWGLTETYVVVRGPMETFSGIWIHTYDTFFCICCKHNMPHQTSDIRLYAQLCPPFFEYYVDI